MHARDQAAAALDEVAAVERRASRRASYPLWFWIISTLGFATLPASTSAGGARDIVALLGVAAILAASVGVERRRRVRDQCLSLGFRGWLGELAVFGPAIVVVLVAVAVSNDSGKPWVTATASVAAGAAWLLAGALTGRVGSSTR